MATNVKKDVEQPYSVADERGGYVPTANFIWRELWWNNLNLTRFTAYVLEMLILRNRPYLN
jgi:hypothetical protein